MKPPVVKDQALKSCGAFTGDISDSSRFAALRPESWR